MLDLEAAVFAPSLIAMLAEQAPSVNLEVVPPGARPFEALETGTVDALIGVVDDAPAGIRKRKPYEDGFVTMMREEHPAAGRTLGLTQFLEFDHVVVSITGTGQAWVDEVLDRQGKQRRVKVRVPGFFAAVESAARCDLVMTLPGRRIHPVPDHRSCRRYSTRKGYAERLSTLVSVADAVKIPEAIITPAPVRFSSSFD